MARPGKRSSVDLLGLAPVLDDLVTEGATVDQMTDALNQALARAGRRAGAALAIAERTIPVLIAAALTDVTGTNLYSEALAAQGLTAFALVGRREVALTPAVPDRQTPATVDALRAAGARETVYPEAP